jgi:hypothetical protein
MQCEKVGVYTSGKCRVRSARGSSAKATTAAAVLPSIVRRNTLAVDAPATRHSAPNSTCRVTASSAELSPACAAIASVGVCSSTGNGCVCG